MEKVTVVSQTGPPGRKQTHWGNKTHQGHNNKGKKPRKPISVTNPKIKFQKNIRRDLVAYNGSGASLQRAQKKPNPYMAQLLNPAAYRDYRLPDNFSRESATISPHLFFKPYYFPANSVVEPPGSYLCVFRPTLVHPFWSYGRIPFVTAPLLVLSNQTPRFGLSSVMAGGVTQAEQDEQMWLPDSVQLNMKLAKFSPNTDYVQDSFGTKDDEGNQFYGHTMAFGTGTTKTLRVSLQVNGNFSTGDKIHISVSNKGGAQVDTEQALTAGTFQYIFSTGNLDALLVNDPVFGLCTPRPGLCIRIKFTHEGSSTWPGIFLDNIQMFPQYGATPPTFDLAMIPDDYINQAEFITNTTHYRPVGASMWLKYEGSTFANGGSHTCVFYPGGGHPCTVGLYNFENISAVEDSWEDKLREGSYQWYKPSGPQDNAFRKVINSEEWTHPYFVAAGIVGDLTQTMPLRAEVHCNYELITTSQLWPIKSVRPNEPMIAAALRFLANAPTSMSNDSHFTTIYNWMKQATKDTMSFVHDNAHWIIPAIGAAATLL